jgi:hypothetical protein
VSLTLEEIGQRIRARQRRAGPVLQAMKELQDRVNGDVTVVLPELGFQNKPAVANLIAQGLDSLALQCSLPEPTLVFPPLDPKRKRGPRSSEYSRIRRLACASWWERNDISVMRGRLFRYLIGYGTAPLVVVPDFKERIPRMTMRNPLHCFPNDEMDKAHAMPIDCGFAYLRSAEWLREGYPEVAEKVRRMMGNNYAWKGTEVFEVFEWNDENELVLFLTASIPAAPAMWDTNVSAAPRPNVEVQVELSRIPNRAGVCTAVIGSRLTLDRVVGQFNALFGMHDAASQLMALDVIAHVKAVFPDIVLIGPPGQAPVLVDGDWIEGRFGVNRLQGGEVQVINSAPPQGIGVMLDRLERNERQEGGITAQTTGELPTNLQTGRAGQNLFQISVSPRIAEYQLTMANLLKCADQRMFKVARAYGELSTGSFYVSLAKTRGAVDYNAAEHFETDAHDIVYPMPGSGPGDLTVTTLQMAGAGAMSLETSMVLNPLIPDPEDEMLKVREESIERLAFQALSAMAQQGTVAMTDLATIGEEVRKGVSWMDAIARSQKAAQRRQATPAEPGSPQTQPGLNAPGMSGAEQPTAPANAGQTPGGSQVRQLLTQIAGGQQ